MNCIAITEIKDKANLSMTLIFTQVGVYAYMIFAFSYVVLLLSTPLFWFTPSKFVWTHLMLTVCHRLIWAAVLFHLVGVQEGVTAAWFQFGVETLFYLPAIGSDLIAIVLKQKSHRNFVMKLFCSLCLVPSSLAFLLSPYWIDIVQARIIKNAQEIANGRHFCLADEERKTLTKKQDLSLKNLLTGKFWNQIEPTSYYLLLIIEANNAPAIMNWSFRSLQFEPASSYFSNLGTLCEPTADPISSLD